MPLNSSGPISMAGTTTGQSINLELGKSATAQISLNDSDARSLAVKPSGQISLNDFYGKSVFGFVEFTAVGTTTWTVPAGYTRIRVLVIGGGGGGSAGSAPVGNGGGGGGNGGAAVATLTVSPGDVATVTVGMFGVRNGSQAEGGGPSVVSINGNTLTGGFGGNGTPSGASIGGSGGTVSVTGAWTNIVTQGGFAGENGGVGYGGAGGSNFYSPPPPSFIQQTISTGVASFTRVGSNRDTAAGNSSPTYIRTGYGAGGCGTYNISDFAGSAGSSGFVRIEYGGDV